ALDNPVADPLVELLPRHIRGDAESSAVLDQVALALVVAVRLPGLDGALCEALVLVRDHQPVVDAHHPAEASAGVAGADRRVEGERVGNGVGVVAVAIRTMQSLGIPPVL